jgi:hypothetical protein
MSVLLIRVVQSEANGTVGFLQTLGLNNDQMQMLWMGGDGRHRRRAAGTERG